jgi:hypothetical protein
MLGRYTVIDMCRAIGQRAYDISTERALQEGISARLNELGFAHRREVGLTQTDRIDFMIGRLGIEVKTKGSRSALLRQIHRYAQSEEIDELLLVTSSPPLANFLPETVVGVRLYSYILTASLI